jgi:carbamoyltransferase
VRDDLNRRVKERYNFQPFAPAVPLERVGEYFECDHAVPWMSEVHRVREDVRARIPAVVHTDGTARVQTVDARDHGWFHALLTAFGARTGVPVLLNTSFNARDEPIVRTAREAVGTFQRTGLDALVVGDRLARRAR